MSADKKGNNAIEKLRILLDNGYKKLHPREGKYLQSLHRRLERTSASQDIYQKRTASMDQSDVNELLKPRVVIHQKEQPKVVEFPEMHPKVEEKQPEEQECTPKDDSLFEVKKVEVEEPEFVEVTTREVLKKEEEGVQNEEKQVEELPQETEDIKDEVVEETPVEKDIPEWEPLQEDKETNSDDNKTADDEFFEGKTSVTKDNIDEECKEEQNEATDEDTLEEEPKKEDDSEWEIEPEEITKEELYIEQKIEADDELLEEEKPLLFIGEDGKENIAFAEVKSIDEKTARLLQENDITSVEILRETPIKKLTKVKGIKRKLAKKIKKEVDALPVSQQTTEDDEDWQLVDMHDDPSNSFEEIGATSTKQTSEKNTLVEEDDEWETGTKEPLLQEDKDSGYRHGEYTLYEKEIETKTGKKRTVRFFSKGEPEEGKSISLPQGYGVKINKRTGVPYLKKSK